MNRHCNRIRFSTSFIVLVFIVAAQLVLAQTPCLPTKGIDGNTEWTFPSFDRSRNTGFSKTYVDSYGDSIFLLDWETQRTVAEHMLISHRYAQALHLLRSLNRAHPDDYKTATLLADGYQLTGKPDSAL